jgi:hypothetical protein
MVSLASNRRWHIGKAPQYANRWADWTRLFLKRLQPNAAFLPRPLLVLHAGVGMVSERYTDVSWWDHSLLQFFPKLCLAIHKKFPVHLLEKRVFPDGRKPLVKKEASAGLKSSYLPSSEAVLPVQRVLARTPVVVELDRLSENRLHVTTVLTEMCSRLVRRALDKCERVEERRMQSLVLRREVRTTVTASDSKQKEIIATSPWGTSVGKPGLAMTTAQIPIDLNRLTDQVVQQLDSRLVAHRERMGMVF